MLIHTTGPHDVDNPMQPSDPTTAAIAHALTQHRRALSQTLGVACTCGDHYRTAEDWRVHLAEIALAVIAHEVTP